MNSFNQIITTTYPGAIYTCAESLKAAKGRAKVGDIDVLDAMIAAGIQPSALHVIGEPLSDIREEMSAHVDKLLATMHQCPNRIVDGHDAGIEIQTNGDTMIDYECESRTQCVTLKFHFCPFCGVSLGESET